MVGAGHVASTPMPAYLRAGWKRCGATTLRKFGAAPTVSLSIRHHFLEQARALGRQGWEVSHEPGIELPQ